jgi:thiamine pyrophosphate-dependent acetolactate synthase large subunit-like protein
VRRIDAIARAAAHLGDDWLAVACNGLIGRELYTVAERPGNYYMIGSMGLAASIGLGLAGRQPDRRVVVFDGDGNVLMGLGALGSVGQLAPPNLYHLVFDNGVHASTGGQRTISGAVPLEEVARACGYRRAARVADPAALDAALTALWADPGPAMLLIEVEPGESVHGIARVEIPPPELARRFRTAATSTRSS